MQCHRHCVWNNALKGVIAVPLKPLGASAGLEQIKCSPSVPVWGRKGLLDANNLRDLLPCALPVPPCRTGHCQSSWLKLLLGTLCSFFFSSWEKQRGIHPLLQFLAPQAAALEMHKQRPLKLLAVGNQRFKSQKNKGLAERTEGKNRQRQVPLERTTQSRSSWPKNATTVHFSKSETQ